LSPRATNKPAPKGPGWLTLLQFSLGALAIFGTWSLALFTVIGGLVESAISRDPSFGFFAQLVSAVGVFFIGLLLLPSTYHALRRILDRRTRPFTLPGKRFGLTLLLLPLILLAGNWATEQGLDALVIPLHIFAALFTVAWLAWLAIRDIELGSAQRGWGAFGAGLAATPGLAFTVEILGGIVVGVFLLFYIGSNPELSRAVERLSNFMAPSTELALENLGPLLNDPVILITGLFSLSVAVPIIEELLKPFGVYLLLSRKLKPAQGFALGALCGAGYALVENLTLNTEPSALFLSAVGRFGTSAMHISTAALSGYAWTRAINEKRWLQLLGFFALSVFLHGAWNAMVLLTSAVALEGGTTLPFGLVYCTVPLLLLIALGSLFFLRRMNRNLAGVYESRISIAPPKLKNL
jgi:RsiW-degrading membrane proteinase PrsW (M82 family)